MRLVLLLALTVPACSFQVDGVTLGEAGALPDLTLEGGPGDDLGPDGDGGAPDLAQAPAVLLELDARSPAVYGTLAQKLLGNLASTAAHYYFDEAGAGGLVDHAGRMADLDPLVQPFPGRRGLFTHIPPQPGMASAGFGRQATEMSTGTGFRATGRPALLDVTTGDFTIEAWFKLPVGFAPASASGCDPIASKVAQTGYRLCMLAEGRLRAEVIWAGGQFKQVDTSVGFADGAWHLATVVFKLNQAKGAGLFVDGRDHTPAGNDLSLPNGASLANLGLFTVGGAGGSVLFRGSLAELVVHVGTALTLADHRASYTAFGLPATRPGPTSGDLSYQRDGELCAVVAVDDRADKGDRVACYAGGHGQPAQVALARSPAAISQAQNPDGLGLAIAPGTENFATSSEQIETWYKSATVTADAAASPRDDLTAEVATLAPATAVYNSGSPGNGNGDRTFSIWLRGRNDGDFVFVRVDDAGNGQGGERAHCLATLTTRWRRYACSGVFKKNPLLLGCGIDTIATGMEPKPGGPVTVELWGAQLERGAAPTPYTPNSAVSASARAPVVLAVTNPQGRYLAGASGRLQLGFTGDAAMADGSYVFDGGPGGAGRVSLRRDPGGLLAGEVLDAAGAGAADSLLTIKAVDFAASHTVGFSWTAGAAPLGGGGHAALLLDGTGSASGRQAAFTAAAPGTVYLGTDQSGTRPASGTLQAVTIWDRP